MHSGYAGSRFVRSRLARTLFSTRRALSTVTIEDEQLRRSYLYVPSSSERMLRKSLEVKSDVIIYDLEDSVAPDAKASARTALCSFLNSHELSMPLPSHVAARINALGTPQFEEDLCAMATSPHVLTLVLPKVHSAEDLDTVSEALASSSATRTQSLRLVASIESARALWDIGCIASWKSKRGPEAGGVLTALLFAAEDYCADTSIIRTPSRLELLYARSRIVLAAKAFRLDAIDMVCVNYKDKIYLKEECEDGRRLGYTGKQAIHPSQVEIIQNTFVPTPNEIIRAAKIVVMMDKSHRNMKGAFGLDIAGTGGKEMIDAPMLKQAQNVLRMARAAGSELPDVPV